MSSEERQGIDQAHESLVSPTDLDVTRRRSIRTSVRAIGAGIGTLAGLAIGVGVTLLTGIPLFVTLPIIGGGGSLAGFVVGSDTDNQKVEIPRPRFLSLRRIRRATGPS